ncbi:MAG: cytochrome c3 family protein [Acidobacteriota bacterium]
MAVRRWLLGIFPQVLLMTSVALPVVAKQHPSLVNPETTRCSTCHQLFPPSAQAHPPAEKNCLTCHRFTKEGEKTQVALAASQPDLCLSCHKGLSKPASLTLTGAHPPVGDQCTSCHEPHASTEKHLLSQGPPKLCLSCHGENDVQDKHPLPVLASSCVGCHAPHGSDVKGMLLGQVLHPPFAEKTCQACHRKGLGSKVLMQKTGAALCFACHSQQEKTWSSGTVHGAVQKGQCTACHNPHLSAQPHLVRATGPALCVGCHQDVGKKLQAKSPHSPAQEDCLTCHQPHQADRSGLLQAPVNELCGNCHDGSDKGFAAKHLQAKGDKLACVGCHDPHGSQGVHLLAEGSSHPPFAEGSCDACHEGSAQKVMEGGSRKLCFACHSDMEENLAKGDVHGAVEAGECVACHSPHASRQSSLLKATPASVCGECHPDQLPGPGETAHGVIKVLGCQACHQPHQGKDKLLRKEGPELCTACHVAKATSELQVTLFGKFTVPREQWSQWARLRLTPDGTRNHPVTGHRVLGTPTAAGRNKSSFTGELSCLTCHDPHKGQGRALARQGQDGKPVTCETCHAK